MVTIRQRQPGKQLGLWTLRRGRVLYRHRLLPHTIQMFGPSSKRRKSSRPRHEPPPPIVHEIDQDVIDKLGYDPRSDVMSEGHMFRTERGLLYQTRTPLGSGRLNITGDDGQPPRAQSTQTPLEQE